MPSTWEPENGRNVATAISLYALHSSQTTKLSPAGPRASGLALSRTSEGGRLFYRPSSLPLPLAPLPLCLPRTALSSHPIRHHPSLLSSLFFPLSSSRITHHTRYRSGGDQRGAFVLRSGGVRIHLACSRATIQGDALISILLSLFTFECYIHQIRLDKQGFSVSFCFIILPQTTPCTGRDASKSENTLKL